MLICKPLFRTNFRYFYSLLFNFYILIAFFDPMRESLDFGIMNSMVSAFRDLIILLLSFLTIFCIKKKKASYFFLMFTLGFFIMIILSLFSEEKFTENIQIIYATYRGFLMCFVIHNMWDIYIFDLSYIIKQSVNYVLLDFVVTLVIYFLFPNLISKRSFHFRISVGNPSMQSALFICGFILCFYACPYKSKLINDIVSFLLLLATFSTITSTATLAFFVVLGLTIFNKDYSRKWLPIVSILIFAFILFILCFKLDITPFTKYFVAKFNEIIIVVSKKIGFETTVTTGYQSYGLRERQIEIFYKNFKGLNIYFGDGVFSMLNPNKYLIENTYYSITRDFGFYGLCLFTLFYIIGFYKSFISFFKVRKYGALIILCVSLVYCVTLYIIAGNATLVQFFFFYTLCHKYDYSFIKTGIYKNESTLYNKRICSE